MACSKLDKKRKVDSENREFKKEWTDKYAFVLPAGSTKPMCLICNETVALVKNKTEILADDLLNQIKLAVKKAKCISLALDESTDNTDNATLLVFVSFFDEERGEFFEDVLGLTTLHGHTRGDDIYEAVMEMLRDREIDLKHVVSIATDGAPNGFVCQPWKGVLRNHDNSNETCQFFEGIIT
ncbi:Zinc finger MYM-type protein 6 [Merluccius polli]|uniref:Zinc finger MYM-type protein 6 n=1 Tax=Merluccius polli TaxID=89951 RepID=A0AA47M0T2_MERPO|nr:Zinc finger MYM-type protein 6 [Merluccius polli]